MISIRAKLLGAVCAMYVGGAWAQTVAQVVEKADTVGPSFWDVLVLGIPVGVLAASLVGSSARTLREESLPDKRIPRRAMNTLIDGFIGGWVAMFLLGFTYTRPYFEHVAPAVLGAFGGLLTEYIRTNAPRWAEQAWTAALSWISKRPKPGDSPS